MPCANGRQITVKLSYTTKKFFALCEYIKKIIVSLHPEIAINQYPQSMCTVDKKTITHVNNLMIHHVKIDRIPVQDSRDGHIVVPVHVLGSHHYRMSIDRVNEIYSQARRSVVGSMAPKK